MPLTYNLIFLKENRRLFVSCPPHYSFTSQFKRYVAGMLSAPLIPILGFSRVINSLLTYLLLAETLLLVRVGFSEQEDVHDAEAKAHNAAMRTITIMLPVRYNESPTPVHEQLIPPSVEGGPSHGPLNGQLVGSLSREPPFVVSRWSARFDVPPPPPQRSGTGNAPAASEADRDGAAKKSPPKSPSIPGFVFNMLTGGRYPPPPPPPRDAPPAAALTDWNGSPPADEIRRQQMTSRARPEVEWQPSQLVQRYVELHRRQRQPLVAHRDGHRGDTVLKNNVVMTAVAYGLLGHPQHLGDGATPPSTTTAATTDNNRKRKFSAEYRHRTSGRYRSS